jgi:general secretion pathway protein D
MKLFPRRSHAVCHVGIVCLLALLLAACAATTIGSKKRTGFDFQEHLEAKRADSKRILEHNEQQRQALSPTTKPVLESVTDPNAGRVETINLSPDVVGNNVRAQDRSVKRFQVSLDFQGVALRDFVDIIFREYLKQPYTLLNDFDDVKLNVVLNDELSESELLRAVDSLLTFHGAYVKYSNGLYAIGKDFKKPVAQSAPGYLGASTGIFRMKYVNSAEFLTLARLFLTEPKSAVVADGANLVFAFAPRPELDAIDELRRRIDIPLFAGTYLLLYTPRYLTAKALKVLVDKFGESLSGKKGVPMLETNVVPIKNQLIVLVSNLEMRALVVNYLEGIDGREGDAPQTFQRSLSGRKAADVAKTLKSVSDLMFRDSEPVNILTDKESNSLFIIATADQYSRMQELLSRLDRRPAAAHIDVTVIEVSLNDSLRYGVEWFLDSVGGSILSDAALNLANPFLASTGSGLDVGIVSRSTNKFIALQLLATETDFTILSNPQVIVRNGATAFINIGQEVAILSSTLQTDTSGSTTQTSFDRRDVAISLEVTPEIGADGSLQLKFKLKDERFAGTDGNNQPIFNKREVITDLVTQDGQTLFLGGIIQDTGNQVVGKLPVLGDLPVVGKLFSNNDQTGTRTELVVFLTPRIIRDSTGAELVNQALLSVSRQLGRGEQADANPVGSGADSEAALSDQAYESVRSESLPPVSSPTFPVDKAVSDAANDAILHRNP